MKFFNSAIMFAVVVAGSVSSASAQFTPAQIRTAYGFNLLSSDGVSGVTGAGQTIAIIDGGNAPTISNDLATFSSHYGLPYSSSNLQIINLTEAGASTSTVPATDTNPETTLDVEYAHAIAPQAKIVLLQAPELANGSLDSVALNNAARYAVTSTTASVVSMSFGGIDYSGESSTDGFFQSTSVNGGHNVAFLASTGDSSYPSYPATAPNVVAVGGTTLTLTNAGLYGSEKVWNTAKNDAAGAGKSVGETEPAYQQLPVRPAQTTGFRTVPDVSYDADPSTGVYIYDSTAYQGTTGYYAVGGTSAGTPQWAGLLALADQARSANGLPAFTTDTSVTSPDVNVLFKLYTLYGNQAAYTAAFHDITSGSSGSFSTTFPSEPTATGYDLATGLGTPIADDLVPYLAVAAPEPTALMLVPLAGLLLHRRRRLNVQPLD